MYHLLQPQELMPAKPVKETSSHLNIRLLQVHQVSKALNMELLDHPHLMDQQVEM